MSSTTPSFALVQGSASPLAGGSLETITSFEIVGGTQRALTIFTPPSDCDRGIWTSNTSAYGALLCSKAYTSSCFPSGYSTGLNMLYSPGVCPEGYLGGPTFSATNSTQVQSCVCCPRSLTFNQGALNCQGLVTDATAVVIGNATKQFTGSFTAVARLVLVAWEASDLLSFSPLSAPLLQAVASTTSEGSGATDATDPVMAGSEPSDTSQSPGGLALGGKIGVGVGVGGGILLLCILAGFAIYRHRLRRMRETESTTRPAAGSSTMEVHAKAELGGDSHVVEIDGRDLLSEADGNVGRHELEGDWHGYEARGK